MVFKFGSVVVAVDLRPELHIFAELALATGLSPRKLRK
jgi:hypothetical protein